MLTREWVAILEDVADRREEKWLLKFQNYELKPQAAQQIKLWGLKWDVINDHTHTVRFQQFRDKKKSVTF